MRKGSLSLSINAIVVLILAVTLLSLGLTFINKTFGGATDQLGKSLKGIDEDRKIQLLSKCSDDACLEQSSMELARNSNEVNFLVLNNKLDCELDVKILIDMENCQVIGEEAKCEDVKLSSFESQIVPPRQKVLVPITVSPKNGADSTTYRYKIVADGTDTGGENDCQDSKLLKQLWLDVNVG